MGIPHVESKNVYKNDDDGASGHFCLERADKGKWRSLTKLYEVPNRFSAAADWPPLLTAFVARRGSEKVGEILIISYVTNYRGITKTEGGVNEDEVVSHLAKV